MVFPAHPPLPPDVDPDLWFDTQCGRHYLLDGNAHTFPGRMLAYCAERGIRTRVSKGEIGDCSEQSRYFVRGFLSGNEPAPPDSNDGIEPAYLAWSDAAARFRDTGYWLDVGASGDASGDVDTDPSEGTDADCDGGGDTDAEGEDLAHRLLASMREQQTVRVALVVDVPNSDADHAIEVATTLAERVGRRTCDGTGPVEVGRRCRSPGCTRWSASPDTARGWRRRQP